MKYEDTWLMQDEITAVANSMEKNVWELRYDRIDSCFKLELMEHLDDDEQDALISQMPLQATYDGEGLTGSRFTLYAEM